MPLTKVNYRNCTCFFFRYFLYFLFSCRPPPNQTSPRDVVDGRSQGPPPTRQEDALPAVLEFREDSKLKSFSL